MATDAWTLWIMHTREFVEDWGPRKNMWEDWGYRVKVRRVNGEVNLSREAAESVQCPMTDTLF